jgi:hypothetical protein
MNVMRYTAALVLAMLTPMLADFAAAQTAVVEGARIRIRLPGQEPIVGRLIAVSGDSLLLSPPHTNDFRTYPLSEIQSVKVSHAGIDDGAWNGMIIGSLAFATLFGSLTYQDDDALGFTLFGAFLGSAIGLVFGHAASRETWAAATVPTQRQERLPPSEARAALRTQLQLDALKPSRAIRLYALSPFVRLPALRS